jgi:heptaprenyl diphosphate synthase
MRRNKLLFRISRIAVYAAVAAILFMVESLLPPLVPLAPGAKIGLSNIVTLLAVITLGYFDAGIVLVVRCLLGAVFGGNWFGLVYSLGGGLSAYIVMCLLYRLAMPKISVTSVSVAGAIVHNAVQIGIAALLIKQINYVLVLPYMLVFSVLAGLLTGAACLLLVKYLPSSLFSPGVECSVSAAENIFEESKISNNKPK